MTLSPNRESSSHLDPSVFDDLRRQMPGRPDILIRIIHSFLRTSPDLLAALQAAIRSSNPEAVRQTAHAMKSSNAQIGAKQLAAMCYELELLGSMGQLLDVDQLLAELEQEYQWVEEELGVLLARLQSEIDKPTA
jgi:HPt (histidine-containing phosphotransfer) domain-containing protein